MGDMPEQEKQQKKKAMGFLKASVFPTSISLLIHTLEARSTPAQKEGRVQQGRDGGYSMFLNISILFKF